MQQYNRKHPPILPVERDLIQKFINRESQFSTHKELLEFINKERAVKHLPIITKEALKSIYVVMKYKIRVTGSKRKNKPLVLPKIDLPQDVLDTNFFKSVLDDDDYI